MKIYFLITLIVGLLNINLLAQALRTLETQHNRLNNVKVRETASLDSLQNIFNLRIMEIDEKKKSANNDADEIKKLMASSVVVSNKIEQKQRRISSLTEELIAVSHKLDVRYSLLIDSLETVEKSNFSADKNELRAQILELIEKKLLISPRIVSLSFNPEKILSLNPSSARNETEKRMYKEYLAEALSEVDKKLSEIKDTGKEVKQVLSLQRKSKKFLEEVEFNSGINRTSFSLNNRNAPEVAANNTDKTFGAGTTFSLQFQAYAFILKQLDVKSLSDLNTDNLTSTVAGGKKIGLKEYSNLLGTVEKRLNEYRTVLLSKVKKAE